MSTAIWIDARGGVAGDMLLGACVDAGADLGKVQAAIHTVIPHEVHLTTQQVMRSSVRALKADVTSTQASPHHRALKEIRALITSARERQTLHPDTADAALNVFELLGQAEAEVHGTALDDVEFHEVGSWDSIADIVGTCEAMRLLGACEPGTRITASEVALGHGKIRAAHGWLSVPAPAVARLALGWQVSSIPEGVTQKLEHHGHAHDHNHDNGHSAAHAHGHHSHHHEYPEKSSCPDNMGNPGHEHGHEHGHTHQTAHDQHHHDHASLHPTQPAPADNPIGELATPTGMALLRHFAKACEDMPAMQVKAIGSGAGGKDIPGMPNRVRIFIGDTETIASQTPGDQGLGDRVVEVAANVDDMDPRLWPGVIQTLLDEGAKDAWLTPITGKKGRPAHIITALCTPEDSERMARIILTHTTTLGVRIGAVQHRVTWARSYTTIDIQGHKIRLKHGRPPSEIGDAPRQVTPEFEDIAAAAKALNIPEIQVLQAVHRAADGH
ncbi:MAG: LarC family nickel insertion protein [Actinomycetaceae bacterium]|nr:LarC family nickel insertion protein [Actinomycetaceae bacterium]